MRILHTMLRVLEKSIQFYTEVLGMTCEKDYPGGRFTAFLGY